MRRAVCLFSPFVVWSLGSAEKLQVPLVMPERLFADLARATNVGKDPFETSAHFAERAARKMASAIPNDKLFLSVDAQAEYNADTETAILTGPSRLSAGSTPTGFFAVPVAHVVTNQPAERWANAFNRRMIVEVATIQTLMLMCQNTAIFEGNQIRVTFSMPRTTAKKRLASLRLAIEVSVIRPANYATELVSITIPTFERPKKLTFIDERLRVVLRKAFLYDPKTKEIIYSKKFETVAETEARLRSEEATRAAAKDRAIAESRKHPMLDGVIADPSSTEARVLEILATSHMYPSEVVVGIRFTAEGEWQTVGSWAEVRQIVIRAPGESVWIRWRSGMSYFFYGERELKLLYKDL